MANTYPRRWTRCLEGCPYLVDPSSYLNHMRDDHSCVVLNVPTYRKKIEAVVPRYQTMNRVHYLGVVLKKSNLLLEFRKLVGGLQILLWHTNKWEENTSEKIAMSGHIRAGDHGPKSFLQEGYPLTTSPPIRLHLERHDIIATLQAANTTSLVVYIDFQSGVDESVGTRKGTCRPSQRRPPTPPLPPPQEMMRSTFRIHAWLFYNLFYSCPLSFCSFFNINFLFLSFFI